MRVFAVRMKTGWALDYPESAEFYHAHLKVLVCLICGFTSQSTTMVMSRRLVNLTTLFLSTCDQVRPKPACSASGATGHHAFIQNLGISTIASKSILLSRERITQTLIRLRGYIFFSIRLQIIATCKIFCLEPAHSKIYKIAFGLKTQSALSDP